uniref:Uncharacterized protein n=1 Tax=Picea glauca TaxID=3330 RepID=A0A117NIS7_PICGL|nr:hypothetical protein ABT39_MTgene279 [Picea glauca]
MDGSALGLLAWCGFDRQSPRCVTIGQGSKVFYYRLDHVVLLLS